MSLGDDTRLSVLDGVLDEQITSKPGLVDRVLSRPAPIETLAGDLFGVVDVLTSSVALRRALSDPGSPEGARRGLAEGVFDKKISDAAVTVVVEAAAVRWPGGATFTAAIERQAVRAQLVNAESAGQLEETEDELFRFARLVASDPALRQAVGDRTVALGHRQELVEDLLRGKVSDATIVLARRAVLARERTFDATLESYVSLAAEMKNRVIATVRVSRPLTDEQVTRMEAALSRQAGRRVDVQVVVDPTVLGGVRVELGDEVIEGTVAAKLESARRLFS